MESKLENLENFKALKLGEERFDKKEIKQLQSSYNVTSPLPPIFSSQLCFSTPPIHFLSRSLPRLDTIKWCQPEEYMVDDADEYMNNQFEQDLKDFYIEARENEAFTWD